MIVAAIVVQNLLYVLGAAVGILLGALAVTVRHRRPTSVEANMALFHKSLRAMGPDEAPVRRQLRPAPAPPSPRARTVHAVGPTPAAAVVPSGAGSMAPADAPSAAQSTQPPPRAGRGARPVASPVTEAETV